MTPGVEHPDRDSAFSRARGRWLGIISATVMIAIGAAIFVRGLSPSPSITFSSEFPFIERRTRFSSVEESSPYTATIIKGQVFLSATTHPREVIGPFIKGPDGDYTFDTRTQGVHSIFRVSDGGWAYSWNLVKMRNQPVDGRALEGRYR
jgi:hypothetical protein